MSADRHVPTERSHGWLGVPRVVFAAIVHLASVHAVPAVVRVPDQYPSIQDAVYAAPEFCTIYVAPGTYEETIVIGDKSVEIVSLDGAASTTIQPGEHFGSTCTLAPGTHPVLIEGFTLRDGSSGAGGAILCDDGRSMTIRACIFESNYGEQGGALAFVNASSVLIEDCVFRGNLSHFNGGAIVFGGYFVFDRGGDALTISNSRFEGNYSNCWNGVLLFGGRSLTIRGCTIANNSVGAADDASTGGISAHDCSVSITSSTFVGNRHGALSVSGIGVVADCSFLHNKGSAASALGAIAFERCVFGNNSSRMYGEPNDQPGSHWVVDVYEDAAAAPSFDHCTFVRNDAIGGSALFCSGAEAARIANTIFAFGTSGGAVAVHELGVAPLLTCCNIFGNAGGDWQGPIAGQLGSDHNLSVDPQFCSVAAEDFTLAASSPCLERGDCGTIGALGEGCTRTPIEESTWGRLKALYGR